MKYWNKMTIIEIDHNKKFLRDKNFKKIKISRKEKILYYMTNVSFFRFLFKCCFGKKKKLLKIDEIFNK